MTTVADTVRAHVHALPSSTRPCRIALLGVGQVGSAVAALVSESALSQRFSVTAGLVRDPFRERPHAKHLHLTSSLRQALDGEPDLVIEALGGLEPARTLVLDALARGIPVVTANKSLLAAHGDVLLDAAARAGVPLRYEAAVLAGVPFLGAFARRSLAREVTGFCGIVNGTTNFVLSTMAQERSGFAGALAEAQRRGYAEPDPANDVNGVDAVEKLCVLARHFGDWSVRADDVDVDGISEIQDHDIQAAAEFGGALKPVVLADWRTGELSAFAGPAFVPASHLLARVDGVQNAVVLRNRRSGDLLFAGPGAGPTVTAATLLDDAAEIVESGPGAPVNASVGRRSWKPAHPLSPLSGWFVRISAETSGAEFVRDGVASDRLPDDTSVADLLSAYGVWLRRTSDGREHRSTHRWFLTHPCAQSRITDALHALGRAAGCQTLRARILEA